MLNKEAIKKLIEEQQLITDYIDLDKQLQPSGFDISLQEIQRHTGPGAVDFSNKNRVISNTEPMKPNSEGWYHLEEGCYKIIYNEVVRIPLDIMALARSRSTMLRNGAAVETAVWDPGYQGRSSSLLVVHNPNGIRLKRDARVAQLVFLNIEEAEKGYDGIFNRERMSKDE